MPSEQNSEAGEEFVAKWRKLHDFDLFQINNLAMLKMLAAAIEKAGSTDAYKVALALEGQTVKDPMGHDYIIRKEDRLMREPPYAAQFVKDMKYDSEKTGLGWKTATMVEAAQLAQPPTCKMKRLAS